jgi:hypothetical protein
MSDRFAGQKALFINCSIKHDKSQSHTQLLLDKAAAVMAAEGVEVEQIYALEHTIAVGMIKDGSDDGLPDDWPGIQAKIMAADILVLGTPIWLGAVSSVCAMHHTSCTRPRCSRPTAACRRSATRRTAGVRSATWTAKTPNIAETARVVVRRYKPSSRGRAARVVAGS